MDLSYKEVYVMNQEKARRQIVETYMATGNLSETARLWHTSRHLVRKWVRRYREEGLSGLVDRSRRPQRSPNRTAAELEEKVVEARKRTGYERKRLSWHLLREEELVLGGQMDRPPTSPLISRAQPGSSSRSRGWAGEGSPRELSTTPGMMEVPHGLYRGGRQ